jgi:carbonic anhydrase
MVDLTYRIAPRRAAKRGPMSAAQAQNKLERGNGVFSDLIAAMRSGKALDHVTSIAAEDLGTDDTEHAVQAPYAAILACSDARVPTEMVFQQGFNDLFVVRVAGNVLGSECLGSLRYATSHFPDSLKVAAVVGHANCGAVTAAVDAFLNPGRYLGTAGNYPLRTIIDQIMVSARSADKGLREVHGADVAEHPDYRQALIGVSVAINAAWNAFSLREELVGHSSGDVKVVFGIYDLGSHRMGLIPTAGARPLRKGFQDAPPDVETFRALVADLCRAALAPGGDKR